MDTLLHDVRFAVRSLAKSPGFAAIAVSCIALGIAANVFAWSPFNALVIRPLPYRESERIMHLSMYQTSGERHPFGSWSYPDYADLARTAAERHDVFEETGAFAERSFNIGGVEEPERIAGARVTASLFPMLGLRPALGRLFRTEDDSTGRVVVLGYGVWKRMLGGDPATIGKSITVNGEPFTVIGVMEEGIRFPETEDVWVTFPQGGDRERRDGRYIQVLGRLANGVTLQQAEGGLSRITTDLAQRYPATNRGYAAWMQPYQEDVAGQVRPIFLIMIGAVACVLLVACANVANLLLARGSVRQREIAVRSAMGASRSRIVRQLLSESVILAIVGGGLGVLLGSWSVDLFTKRMVPTTVPFWMKFGVDGTVLAVSAGLTMLTGVLFGLAPAMQLSRPALSETLKETGGRGATGGARAGRIRSALVVAQLSLSLVLLVGAMLMIRSFLATQTANLGFRPDHVVTMDLALSGPKYRSDSTYRTFLQSIERDVAAIPGVQQVGLTGSMPIKTCCNTTDYFPEGKTYPLGEGPSAIVTTVSSGFFRTLGIPLRAGRNFDSRDTFEAPRVAIVSELFAQREWPNRSAIGQRFRDTPNDTSWVTVVGVVPFIVSRDVTQFRTSAQVYYPLEQARWRGVTIAVRTAGDPLASVAPIRERLRALDRDLPLARVEALEFTIRDRMFQPRVYGTMFAGFAATALLLASIGLYGVMAYVVSQRTHEMGIRMALGATRSSIVTLVLSGGVRLIAIGVLIGVPAALGLAQLLRRTLFGVSPTDPLTFLAIPFFLVTVALLATVIPARRAASVDPSTALHTD